MKNFGVKTSEGGGLPPYHNEGFVPDGYKAGNWYLPDVALHTISVATAAIAGKACFLPFTPRKTHTFAELRFYANGSGNFRLCIAESGTDGQPSALLLESPSLAHANGLNDYTVNQELKGGVKYWLGLQVDANTGAYGFTQTPGSILYYPVTGAADGFKDYQFSGEMFYTPVMTQEYGAFTDPVVLDDSLNPSVLMPLIWLKG